MAYSENLTADGNTSVVTITDAATKVRAVGFSARGTFGSGTAKLQGRLIDDTSTWIDLGSTLTADGQITADVCGVDQLRVNLNGATSPDIDVKIYGGRAKLTVTES